MRISLTGALLTVHVVCSVLFINRQQDLQGLFLAGEDLGTPH